MSFHSIVLFVLAVSFSENSAARFKLTNAVCESYNQTWVTIEHCRLHAIRRDKTVITIEATLHYPVKSILLKYKVLKRANGYKPWLFDGTIDACAFMQKPNHPVGKMVYNLVKGSTTINHTSPYVGQQRIKDFYLKAEQMPVPLPTGDYAAMMTWIFSGRPQFATNVYFRFEEDIIDQ